MNVGEQRNSFGSTLDVTRQCHALNLTAKLIDDRLQLRFLLLEGNEVIVETIEDRLGFEVIVSSRIRSVTGVLNFAGCLFRLGFTLCRGAARDKAGRQHGGHQHCTESAPTLSAQTRRYGVAFDHRENPSSHCILVTVTPQQFLKPACA